MKIGEHTITRQTNLISKGEKSVKVSPLAIDVLLFLAEKPGVVISQEILLQRFWNAETATENALYKVIAELRKAMGDQSRTIIKTVPKRGYCLLAEIEIPQEKIRHNQAAIDLLAQRLDEAEEATRKLAYPLAIRHWKIALELLEKSAPRNPVLECEVTLKLARCVLFYEGKESARPIFDAASQIATQTQNHEAYCQAILGLSGGMPPLLDVDARAQQRLLQTALQRLDSKQRSLALQLRTRLLYYLDSSDTQRQTTASSLVEEARRQNDANLLAQTLVCQHSVLQQPRHHEIRSGISRELIELSSELDDRDLIASAILKAIADRMEAGEVAGLAALQTKLTKLAPAHAFKDDQSRLAANLSIMTGDLVTAEELSLAARTEESGPAMIQMLQIFQIRRFAEKLTSLMPLIETYAQDQSAIPGIGVYLALGYAESQQLADFHSVIREQNIDQLIVPPDASWHAVIAALMDCCFYLKDKQWADRVLSIARDFAGLHLTQGAVCYFGAGNYFIGRLEMVRGELDAAADSLHRALLEHEVVGTLPMQMRTCDALASVEDQRNNKNLANDYRLRADKIRSCLRV